MEKNRRGHLLVTSVHKYSGVFGDAPLFTSYLNTAADNSTTFIRRFLILLLSFLDCTGRNVGQVCFANNPISGLFILIGLGVGIPVVSLSTLFASTIGIFFALMIKLPTSHVSAGLTCYNAALLGAVLPALLIAPGSADSSSVWLSVAVGAVITIVMTVSLGNSLGSLQPAMPIFTIPFNLVALFMIMNLRVFAPPSEPQPTDAQSELAWQFVMQGSVLGAGQVFAVQDWWCSGLVLFGMALCSPILAVAGFLGSLVATLCAVIVSPSLYAAAYAGIYGYNGFLAACAVSFFFVPTWRSALIALVNAVLAAIIQVALASALSNAHLPVLTLPFVGASLLLLGISAESSLPRPQQLTFPEQHILLWRRRFSADSTSDTTEAMP